MSKRPIIQTVFKAAKTIEEMQAWANEFLLTHEAVNLQVCNNDAGSIEMMIVYKVEVEEKEAEIQKEVKKLLANS